MRRKIPSTAALTAFEAASRHRSFTRAADELSITQSAVCRQIAGLEDFLGLKLFGRTRGGVMLTEAGSAYSRSIRARLREVERDTLALMIQGGAGGTLELGVVPTFATRWLLPRLNSFKQAFPAITVNMTPKTSPFLFEDSGLDATLYAGEGGWPGTHSCRLFEETLIAVGCAAMLPARRKLRPSDLIHLPLLQQSTRPYLWREWFESQGLRAERDLSGPRMELFSMLSQAAIHGHGVALIPRMLIEEELANGQLLQLLPLEWPSGRSYFLLYPEQKAAHPALVAFKSWIVSTR